MKKTILKPLLVVFPLALSLIAQPSHAVLIGVDDPVFGVGAITLDTDSGLEWLDLSVTRIFH